MTGRDITSGFVCPERICTAYTDRLVGGATLIPPAHPFSGSSSPPATRTNRLKKEDPSHPYRLSPVPTIPYLIILRIYIDRIGLSSGLSGGDGIWWGLAPVSVTLRTYSRKCQESVEDGVILWSVPYSMNRRSQELTYDVNVIHQCRLETPSPFALLRRLIWCIITLCANFRSTGHNRGISPR